MKFNDQSHFVAHIWNPALRQHKLGSSRREEAPFGKSEIRNPKSEISQSLLASAATTALFLLLAAFAHAQTSQFLFDDNGNLTAQTGDSTALPQIIGQPQNQIVEPGEIATFSVIVADPRQLTYQWRFNGVDIGSATNEAFLLQNVSTNNEGEYRVVLTNPSGSVTSAPAMLWVDSRGVGMPDSWQMAFFGNLDQLPNRDFDGDGSSNLQEFLNGTDPTDPNSVRFRLLVTSDGGSVIKVADQSSYTNGETVMLTAIGTSNAPFHAWFGDILTRSNPVTLVMTNNKTVLARFTPIGFNWTNTAGGDWNDATNWTPNLVPGSNDTVSINGFVTVTLNTAADCFDLTLGAYGGPTLTTSGTLTVRGNLSWTAGTMSGSGRTILEAGATLLMNNPGTLTLTGRTLENGGTVLWTGAGAFVLSSTVITNRAGALFQVQNAGALVSGGVNRFDNAGTFRKAVNSGTTTIPSGITFNNSGAVDIQAGTLELVGGTNSGSVTVSAGATLNLSGGTHTADANSTITGAGQLTVSGGTANLAGLVNVSGSNTFSPGGTANLTGNYNCVNNTLLISGSGTANFNGSGTIAPAVVLMSNGTLGGSNLVTVASQMLWTGGTMSGSGRTVIAPGATLNVNNTIPGSPILATRTLDNGGTVFLTGTGNLEVIGSAVITNRPGAVFNFENESSLGLGGFANGRFDNAGTFRKTTGTGTSVVSGLGFNNSGTVEIQTGTLLCNGGFTNNGVVNLSGGTTNRLVAGGSATGSFSAPASARVEWTGGTFTLNAGAQLNGAGLYRLNGGTLTANPNLTVENLDLVHASSTLGGTGAVTIASGMNWTAGTMSGSGRTIIPAGVLLNLAPSSSATLGTRTLENGGTILWTGAGFNLNSSAVITNRPGALFRAESEAINGLGGAVASGRFDNAGTFRKSAGIGTTTVASGVKFTNYNTVDIRSGILAANGGYASSTNAQLNCALGGTTPGTNYGQLQVAGTVTLNGGLSVDLLPGFSRATNDTFTVLTAGTRNSAFATFSYPSNRVTLSLSNSPTSVILRVTDVLPIPQPVLLTPQVVGSNALLTWTATSNVTYRLESIAAVSSTNWTALTGDVTTLSNTASKLDPFTPSNRFYRVRVLP